MLRYSRGDEASGFNVTAMGYRAKYNATDQIPQRAVDAGTLDRFSSIDPTDGGSVHRYSLSGEWHRSDENSATNVNAYVIDNRLRIYSNFTYFLDDPINGDQFGQPDDRNSTALNASHSLRGRLFGRASETTFGVQAQHDIIRNALTNTKARRLLSVTRSDRIKETSAGAFVENTTRWTDQFRTVVGLRGDFYKFDVESSLSVNSGKDRDAIVSPKLSLIFGPFSKTELYVNVGSGFHSNDARGTTISIDPKSGDFADRVPGLVRAKGIEAGVRSEIIPRLQSTLSVYGLDFDSELTFAGDAGTTNAGRPSRRTGFELSNYYKPTHWLTIDATLLMRGRGFAARRPRVIEFRERSKASPRSRSPSMISALISARSNCAISGHAR